MAESSLVIDKIESMNIEEKYKKAMVELFRSELQYGTMDGNNVKKAKATRCREIVTKVVSRENL